jgi:hypothetical protein
MVNLISPQFKYVLAPVLLAGLMHGWRGASTTTSASPAQPMPTPSMSTSSVSDFDSDNLPDLATSRYEIHGYTVEIDLSTQHQRTRFTVPGSGLMIRLLAIDLDHDSDQDLVITNALSSQPLAVWLGDGAGHFEKGDLNSYPGDLRNSFGIDDPSVNQHDGAQADQASLSQNQWPPFDKSSFPLAQFNAQDSIPDHGQGVSSQTFINKLAARSPPLTSSL